MTEKQSEAVELKRTQKRPRRRFPWGVIALLLAVLLVAVIVWLYGRRIAEMMEPEPTLPPMAEETAPGVLYQTDFDDPARYADWDALFDDGFISAAFVDGQLVVDINALEDTGAWLGLNAASFSDFVLDVDATKLGGPDDNGIMVIFRRKDDDNYNRFDISSDGYYSVSMLRGGEYAIVSDWKSSPAILTGEATNHIRIWAIGDTFRFEVNGAPLLLCVSYAPDSQPIWDPAAGEPTCLGGEVLDSWRNGDLLEGRIGLGAQGFSGFDGEKSTPARAMIGFDNLLVQVPGNVAP